jgi:putative FmdB family regulatory protein
MPYYDFVCDNCGQRVEVKRSMAEAGKPEGCASCQQPMRRIYDTEGTSVILRPWNYRAHPESPQYWEGFNNPVNPPHDWQKPVAGRKKKADPERSPQYAGSGDLPYKA